MSEVKILFLNGTVMEELGAGDKRRAMEDVKEIYHLFNYRPAPGETNKKLTIPDKVVLRFGETQEDEHRYGRINAMPGRIQDGALEVAGIKWIGSGPDNQRYGLPRASALVILNDPITKVPICIANATGVSAARTGASGGIAVEYLSRRDATSMVVCGAGVQGRAQIDAALLARPKIERIAVYDQLEEKAKAFVDRARSDYPQIRFVAVTSAELKEAVGRSDIVVTATTTDTPIIQADWVRKGQLLLNISGDEYERDCILRADKTIVDFWTSIKHRNSSSIAHMVNDPQGLYWSFAPTAEMGEIINGDKPGRERDDEIIYFNAVGAGVRVYSERTFLNSENLLYPR